MKVEILKNYPKGIINMLGKLENVILITYNDTETGENMGFRIHSLDKDEMKIMCN